jgi:single-stranded DNA-binding protein
MRDDSPKESLKVVGWGNLANTIKETYHPGDRLIIEGRLGMNMIERQEGFKEKRAELTASRISLVDSGNGINPGELSSPPEPEAVDLSNTDDIPF